MLKKATSQGGRKARQTAIRRNVALLSETDSAQNVRIVWDRAVEAGTHLPNLSWYLKAQELVREVSGLDKLRACGIAAALSPQNSWDQNVTDLEALVQNGHTTQTADAERKAQAILNGHSPYSVLGGRKVRSFFANLYTPEHAGYVTVDRHAVSIALGRPLYGTELKALERVGTYVAVSAAYRTVARELDILPNQVQAVTWCQWRQEHAPGWAARDNF